MNRVDRIAFEYLVRHRVRRVLPRTASSDPRMEDVAYTLVTAGLMDWLKRVPQRSKEMLDDAKIKLWEKVDRRLARVRELFREPKLLSALLKLTRDNLTPKNILAVVKEGKRKAEEVFKAIRMFLTTPSGVLTLTQLLRKTAVGAGIAEWFNDKVRPRADQLEALLQRYLPTLSKLAKAALFIWIWINVDEISWELPDLIMGFTGQLSVADLLVTLPESLIGAISGALFGVGYTIMPYMIAIRLAWMLANKYLEWDGREWKPNFTKVDRAAFEAA